jgi:hypothetical protein
MKMKHPVMKALDETGLPWHIEQGHGHKKIRLCGRLVGVIGHNQTGAGKREIANVVAQIRRAAREVQHERR